MTEQEFGRENSELKREMSDSLFQQAQEVLVGGVNSPVRAFKGVGGAPLFIARGEGAYLIDADGNRYIDYIGSWGPMIVGHTHPQVLEAVRKALEKGASFGAPTEAEVALAKVVVDAVPSIEMVRFVNSGTEATMSAIRLARGFTGRDKIIKFEGCYHGHADMLLVQAGSGVATLGLPDSPGVPKEAVMHTLVAQYNDLESVEKLLNQFSGEVAAIIVEPVAGNMGLVPPQPGFLEGLRALTKAHESLLIFDEVMCGFRVAYGGAQSLYGVTPDLTCLGKIVGGGFPVGAYGGRADIMQHVAPVGPVYQAGTLSGNPVAMAAGLETLRLLQEPESYPRLEHLSARLTRGIADAATKAGVPICQTRVGSMTCVFFCDTNVVDFKSACDSDKARYGKYFHAMLERGVYLAPSQFETAFVSLAHSDADIDATVEAAGAAFRVCLEASLKA